MSKIYVMGIPQLNRSIQAPGKELENVRCIINVSDEPFHAFHQQVRLGNRLVPYYWHPLIENAPFGYNSIGAAFTAFCHHTADGGDVIIHCHAGINRSATLALLFKLAQYGATEYDKALNDIETYSNPREMKAHNEQRHFLASDIVAFLRGLHGKKTLGEGYYPLKHGHS